MKWIKRFLFFLLFVFVLLNIMSAFHAYKFTHFYNSNRKVKKPDQMNGWEKAGTIITGVNNAKRRITELPSAPYDTFAVRTDDGLSLRGWKIKSRSERKPRGAVILFHGHGSNRSAILSEAEAFNNLNYCVYMIDFRAHGQSDGNVCTIGYKETKDIKSIYNLVKHSYGDSVVLWGISLGASTILN